MVFLVKFLCPTPHSAPQGPNQFHDPNMTAAASDKVVCDAISSVNSPISATKAKRARINTEQKAAERRRRRRVDPAKRKRVAVACDSCKKRKQKV